MSVEGEAKAPQKDPKTRALSASDRPLVRHAERFRLTVTAGSGVRVG